MNSDLNNYDYLLPRELIAQTPAEPRDSSRMMVVHSVGRDQNGITTEHRSFRDITEYLHSGDVLVMNNTRVSAVKLAGIKETGGSVEVLVLSVVGRTATCLVRGKGLKQGTTLILGRAGIKVELVDKTPDGKYVLEFKMPDNSDLMTTLRSNGTVPLPPYIKSEFNDCERYQTVFSEKPGSAAAPTAGLHFTSPLLERIRAAGVETAFITLHIGPGTFRPVTETMLETGRMEAEHYEIGENAAAVISRAIEDGRRIVAVGTTTIRALESAACRVNAGGGSHRTVRLKPATGWTELFIRPGHIWRLPYSGMVTNFHLPRSTLLMLVSAFAGRENILAAYKEAVERKYRFYSFGDAMLILKQLSV